MSEETAADRWRALLRAELLTARKARDTIRVSALRSALAAIDNAETPDIAPLTPTEGAVAGAVSGLGAAEVARKELTDGEIRAIVAAEITERHTVAEQLPEGHERSRQLHAEAAVLEQLV